MEISPDHSDHEPTDKNETNKQPPQAALVALPLTLRSTKPLTIFNSIKPSNV